MSFLYQLFRINQVFYSIFVDMKFSMDELKGIGQERTMARKLRKAVMKKPCPDLSMMTWLLSPD